MELWLKLKLQNINKYQLRKSNNFNGAIEVLQCPYCLGDYRLVKGNKAIECKKCFKKVSIKSGRIFSFVSSEIPTLVEEKTMYGPEFNELKKEIADSKPFSKISNEILPPKEANITGLDFGCGSSGQIFEFADVYRKGIFFGLDYDLSPLRIATAFADENSFNNIFFIENVGERIPLKKESLDIIFSHQSLEHTEKPEKHVLDFARLMKKDAILEADFPNGNGIGERLRRLFHNLRSTRNPHLSRIGLDRAREMFLGNNFKIISFSPDQALTGPLLYFIEGFVLRFVFGKYKLWSIRKRIKKSLLFNMFNAIDNHLIRINPKWGHNFSFIATKKK